MCNLTLIEEFFQTLII